MFQTGTLEGSKSEQYAQLLAQAVDFLGHLLHPDAAARARVHQRLEAQAPVCGAFQARKYYQVHIGRNSGKIHDFVLSFENFSQSLYYCDGYAA